MSKFTKRVVITGANKGIGRALVAEVLSEREDTFVFLGSRDVARGEQARDALVADAPGWAERIEVLQLDVCDVASVEDAAEAVAARFGRDPAPLWGVVNNAGIGFSDASAATVLDVNAWGPRRVCDAFLPLIDPKGGRVVNVASASGPNFIAECSSERQRALTSPDVTLAQIDAQMRAFLACVEGDQGLGAAGFGGSAYGMSKACLNAYTIALARQHPELVINACTPGFIETDMTRGFATARGVTPQDMGMKAPRAGTRAPMHLLFGTPGGSGWYFGSDAQRSPLDRYRSPGDPPYAPGGASS